MALKGTISAGSGISEVLHLVSLQQRPGAIHFSNGEHKILLRVKDREIVSIEWPTRPNDQKLGAMLVAAKLVSAELVERALAVQAQPERLGATLFALGYADLAVIRDILELQAGETLHELFDWTEGEYFFDAEEVPITDGLDPRPVEAVLLEGARRIQLWPIIREKVPSLDQTFERIREAPGTDEVEGATHEEDGTIDFETPMDPNNEPTAFDKLDARTVRVDRLVQPGRTVKEIISLSRLGTFDTCRRLASLITGGYIRLKAPPREVFEDLPVQAPAPPPPPKTNPLAAPLFATVFLLVLATAIMLFDKRPAEKISLNQYRASTQKQILRRGLELYRLQTGSYPHALEQMVDAGILRTRDLTYPYGKPYKLIISPEGQPAISQ